MADNLKHSLLAKNSSFEAKYLNFKGCLNHPLDVAGCTIFICKTGQAEISLNFQPYKIKSGNILILFGDTVMIPISISENFSIFTVSVSDDIIDELLYNTSSDFFDFIYANPILSPRKEQRNLLIGWEQQILWILKPENKTVANKIISNTLVSFFLAVESTVNRIHELTGVKYKASQSWILINKFTKLLFKHGHENRNVIFYANKLCITPGYLYKVVSKIMQTSPKDLIDNYIITEMKILLSTTNLSMKEIADELHFEDSSYMCRFFRKQTGLSLTDYKKTN